MCVLRHTQADQWRWDNLCGCSSLCPGVVPVCLRRLLTKFVWVFICMMTCSINDLFPVETHLWFYHVFFVCVCVCVCICASILSFTHPHPQLSLSFFFSPEASVWQQKKKKKRFSTRSHTEPAETWFESFRFTLSSEQGRSVYGLIRRSWAAKWTTLVMVQFLHWALLIIQYSGGHALHSILFNLQQCGTLIIWIILSLCGLISVQPSVGTLPRGGLSSRCLNWT